MRKYYSILAILVILAFLFTSLGSSSSKVYGHDFPTDTPTVEPSPSDVPTVEPTLTEEPTVAPTLTEEPTWEPGPTEEPTLEPTLPEEPIIEPSPTDSTRTKNSIPVCPLTIGFGKTIQCSILKAGEIDKYSFTANAGDKILVRMSKSSGTLWPKIGVYNPSGVKVCEKSGTTTAEISTCSLSSAGKYTIRASDGYNGKYVGNYYLYMQRLKNPGNTVPITFGQTLFRSILNPAEMDTYTFTANAGDKVLVRMSTTDSLWPGIRIYSPSGVKLCENHAYTKAEIGSCALPSYGKYTILAYDDDGTHSADYYIYMQRLKNPGNSVPITFGQTILGSIRKPAEMDAFTFSASAGDKVLLRLSTTTSSRWPGIRIYSPAGVKLCDISTYMTAEIASCSLTTSGTYTILAYDNEGTHTNDYSIYLQRLNNPGSPVSFSFGQTISGSILSPAQMDSYTFSASAGDKVLLRLSTTTSSRWPGIRIYSPAGVKLCDISTYMTAEIASCSLTTSGTYTILAYDNEGTHTNDYSIYLQRLNNPGSPVSFSFGQTISGSILSPAQMDSYTFTASAGDKVLLRLSTTTSSRWPGIRIYSPAGVKLCDISTYMTAEIASCSLTTSGTYTILAYDNEGTHTNDYSIYLQRLNNPGSPVSFSFGQTISGSILSPAQMDSYTFTASAGDKVLLRLSTTTSSRWPGIRIYSPAGVKLCDISTYMTAEIASCSLTTSGTYTILAYDNEGTHTNDYSIYLQRLNNPGSPVSFSFGQTLPGLISLPAEMDTYAFSISGSGTASVTMSVVTGTFWPGIRIYSPAGVKLCDSSAYMTAEITSCSLTTSGTYTILAYDNEGTHTGSYTIYLH